MLQLTTKYYTPIERNRQKRWKRKLKVFVHTEIRRMEHFFICSFEHNFFGFIWFSCFFLNKKTYAVQMFMDDVRTEDHKKVQKDIKMYVWNVKNMENIKKKLDLSLTLSLRW